MDPPPLLEILTPYAWSGPEEFASLTNTPGVADADSVSSFSQNPCEVVEILSLNLWLCNYELWDGGCIIQPLLASGFASIKWE